MVAPHAGAWIEIFCAGSVGTPLGVAPHAGAWIEMPSSIDRVAAVRRVAPHAGAWIEILSFERWWDDETSRTPRGCVD